MKTSSKGEPWPPKEEHVAYMAAQAREILNYLKARESERETRPIKPNDRTYPRKAFAEWTAKHLDRCARAYKCPPPPELTDLAAHLLGISLPVIPPIARLPQKYWDAMRYLYQHPDATISQIAREVGTTRDSVRKWKKEWEKRGPWWRPDK